MRMTGMELALATGGRWSDGMPEAVSGICTDSRHAERDAAFLALRGPHHDGHAFAAQAAASCTALIGDAAGAALWDGIARPRLVVADTLAALGDIAAAWRQRLTDTCVIAITGSYGKTTVRSMIVHTLAVLGLRVATNPANHNNLVGVPQTLLAIPENAEFAVIECGISEPGEMHRLAGIVQPDAAVMTGLTSAHGQGLGGLEGVVREKFELLAAVTGDGWCVLGTGVQDQLGQRQLTLQAPCIAMDASDEGRVAWSLDGRHLALAYGAQSAEVRMLLPASHWAEDMALAATVVLKACGSRGITLDAVAEALSGWRPVSGRMQLVPGLGGSVILDDSYNANPASMQAALDTLAGLSGKRIAILGDMSELGEDAAERHAAMDVDGIDRLILVGPLMRHLAERHPEALWLPDTDAACRHVAGLGLEPGTHVLVKASRSMHLDRIVAVLARHPEQEASHAV
jgi:UDP-N-acetylmuramoyl-tripeptide--D-alanyl-D-alanine ligase